MVNIEILGKKTLQFEMFSHCKFTHNWRVKSQLNHALLGKNGIGKSSLFKLVKHSSPDFKISYFDQQRFLLSENFKVEDVLNLLIKFHPLNTRDSFKNLSDFWNLDLLNKKFVHFLSGGENQILKIVMTSMMEADVYFFDEPFAHLSEENKEKLEVHFKRFFSKKTLVVADHHEKYLSKVADTHWELQRKPTGILEVEKC